MLFVCYLLCVHPSSIVCVLGRLSLVHITGLSQIAAADVGVACIEMHTVICQHAFKLFPKHTNYPLLYRGKERIAEYKLES